MHDFSENRQLFIIMNTGIYSFNINHKINVAEAKSHYYD